MEIYPEETLHMSFNAETMKSGTLLRINGETAISVSLDEFRAYFRQTNLQQIVCNVTVEEIAQIEPYLKLLKHCKWNECKAFDSKLSIKRHETETCPERIVKCKCDSCDSRILFRNVTKHETICDKKLILSKFADCKRGYIRSEIQIHESNCEFGIVSCKWTNCSEEYPLNEMKRHESECHERTVNCQYQDCDVKCSILNWNLHIRNCKHSFTQELCCSLCAYVGSPAVKLLLPLLTHHLLAEHPNNICEGPNWKKRTIMAPSIDWIYFQYEGLLFGGYCHFYSEGEVTFNFWLVSEEVDFRSEYKYTFKFINTTDSWKTIATEHEIDYLINDVSSDIVKPFIKDNSISYEVTIIKK